jgi:hypothetical protein
VGDLPGVRRGERVADVAGAPVGVPAHEHRFQRYAGHAELLGHLARGRARRVLTGLHAAGREAVVHAGEHVLAVGAPVDVDPSRRVAHQHRHDEVRQVVAAHHRPRGRADDATVVIDDGDLLLGRVLVRHGSESGTAA